MSTASTCLHCAECRCGRAAHDAQEIADLRAALAASERSCGELEATNRLFSEALVSAARDAVCVRARIADAVRDAVAAERAAIRARGGQ